VRTAEELPALPILPTDLSTATPPDIDAHFADLNDREDAVQDRIAAAVTSARRTAGEKPRYMGRSRVKFWDSLPDEAIAKARALAGADPAWKARDAGRAVDAYDMALCDLYALEKERAPLTAEWVRRGGWSRFFEVDANNGHVHSSQRCKTCHRNGKRTKIGWHPELSGLTEKDAVDALGPMLCTVCFPTAPTEWTVGKPKSDACENAPVTEGTRTRSYGPANTRYGDCTQCNATRIQINTNGLLRRHKPVT
jgi:uncharacterized protein YdcH (DUF465 family)